jgi:cysteine synthase A
MVNNPTNRRIMGLSSLIGNTPLLEITFLFNGKKRKIYAKAENFNMTGSIKDRMAFHILKLAYESKDLKPGDLIIEATSGNTGISFSAIGCSLGHPVVIFMPDWMSSERINIIKCLGAKIILVSKEEGGFLGSIKKAEELAAQNINSFLPRQFSNNNNSEAHFKTTGPEIFWQLKSHSIVPEAFIAGVGTGGTIMGTGKYLQKEYPSMKLFPLEPLESPTLSTGHKIGKHRIQGISDEFIPPILHLKSLDHVVGVHDGDAIIMAQKLGAEMGLGVGISSGANFIGALKVQEEMGDEANVVTVFPDDNKKYLSTDLLREEPVKPEYMAPYVKLLEVRSFKRVCNTCCNINECLNENFELETEGFTLPLECPLRAVQNSL